MKNPTKKWLAGIAASVALAMAYARVASAQMLTNPINCNGANGGQCFSTILTNFLGFLFYYIAVPLCAIMAFVGAFQLMTSAGEPEKTSKGKKTLAYAAIGFVVALIAGGITSFIRSLFPGS